ncbi:MAG TPA: type II secretion system protein [Candidatus Saccharimonadales bacterium]|jgi:general secretion pathway protein G|nr:type II secretion system protein [Candidatus Saccharimonadales bacterium]
MRSLKKLQKGFTIVELLIVIVVIGILATLVIVTFTGIQQKARNSQRQTDINAVDSHVEAFYAQYGYYPTLADLQSATFLSTYLKGLDPQALIDPKGSAIAAAATTTAYGYVATGATGCVNTTVSDPTAASTTNNGCDGFTLTAKTEGGADYVKKSN